MVKLLKSSPILTLLIVMTWLVGCQKYGEVSQNTYQYAKSLYSICNMQDTARLSRFVEQIEQDVEIPQSELDWILDIAKIAENGDWVRASVNARQIMMEQTRDR